MAHPESVLVALQRLRQEQGRERRLVAERDGAYMLFLMGVNHKGIRVEVAASKFLPPELKLSPERAKVLRDLGYQRPRGGRNFHRDSRADDVALERLAEEAVDVFKRVYGVVGLPKFRLVLDDSEHPENPDLLDAMRLVSKPGFDAERRRELYTELVNATFLVPVDPEAGAEADGGDEFLVLEQLNRRPVFAVFSDWGSLRLWNPRGFEYIPVHGSEFFELALEHSVASVRINPDGDVGGELYANEVEMLAEAVRRFRRRSSN